MKAAEMLRDLPADLRLVRDETDGSGCSAGGRGGLSDPRSSDNAFESLIRVCGQSTFWLPSRYVQTSRENKTGAHHIHCEW